MFEKYIFLYIFYLWRRRKW